MSENPLDLPCPRCRAAAGQRCKNYKGQNKFTCKARLAPEAEPEPIRPETPAPEESTSLFDDLLPPPA